MWKYVGNGESIPGVPMEDMTDEEFAAAAERHAAAWPEGERRAVVAALEASTLYERVKEPAKRGAAPADGGE